MDLCIEIRKGDLKKVQKLISIGARLSSCNFKGLLPLNVAIKHARFEIAKLLLENGADPNGFDKNGWSPLTMAMKNELFDVAENLTTKGAEKWSSDHWKTYKLFILKDKKTENALQDKKAIFLNLYQDDMDQLIVEGNKYGFDKEGYINFLEFFGPSSLEDAVKNGRFEFLRLLIDHGADLDLDDRNDWTPINIAIAKEHFALTKFLIDNGSYVNSYTNIPLVNACRYNRPEIVNLLIENKAFINCKDKKNGYTAIAMAKKTGFVNIVKIFIRTLFPKAIRNGDLEMVKYLMQEGADPNENYGGEGFPLILAIVNKRLEITKVLIDHGCDINFSTLNGWTPILTAIAVESLELVEVLVENGADLETLDGHGWKPLPFAVMKGNVEIVQYLMLNQVCKDSRNQNGQSSLEVALQMKHISILKIILL